MRIYSIICTRSKKFSDITNKLVSKLSTLPSSVRIMVNQNSIFGGYKKAFDSIEPEDEDLIILCHDDIELPQPNEAILPALKMVTQDHIGFGGVAGTKLLCKDAVWWNQKEWKEGYHSGQVWHTNDNGYYSTEYGPISKVVVMDGLFLVARAKVLKEIGLEKPSYLIGNWDFYDLHYTISAFKKSYTNITLPIVVAHHSSGELVGREGWEENRQAFIRMHNPPIEI